MMRFILRLVVTGKQIVEAIQGLTEEVRRLRVALVPELPEMTDEKDVRLVKTLNLNPPSDGRISGDEWSKGVLNEFAPRRNYWEGDRG
jgi:hypothetical protein